MVRKAILVVGLPGSGKSLIVEAAKSCHIPVFNMGDVIREEAKRSSLKETSENLAKIARELRIKYGSHIIARKTYEKIAKIGSDVVLIDGVRSWDEVEFFNNVFNKVIIIAIHAPRRIRFERLIKRGRKDDPKTWNDFIKRDERELNMGVGRVIALSDFIILNYDRSKDEVIQEAKRLIMKVINDGD